jgi:molecular chaperone HtpG
LEKLRHLQITEKEVYDDTLNLEINITTDDQAGTVTIQDFGIGLNEAEMVENLGTIAHSGTKAFLKSVQEKGETNENVIGQFGVGFYSAFMVADEVKVYSHSWRNGDKGYSWTSDGTGEYEIEESEGQRRGAKLVLKLKEDAKDFAKGDKIKEIIKKYSSFVQFPVNVNGDKVNTMDAIWLRGKSDVKEEDYKEFYKFQANAFDEPMTWLHFNTDAPLTINSLLFVPTQNMEQFGMGRMESKVALHCRKVLIDSQPKNLLPEWLRFLSGVIDSLIFP